MKIPKYLSPSSIATFRTDRSEFYLKYLADDRPPKIPQSQPMAAGSAFDAYVKSYIHHGLFGNTGPTGQFELNALFEAQVEPQNRDWGFPVGRYLFDCYKSSGALADLMVELQAASGTPRFEFTIEGRLSHETVSGGVPLLGKPDVYFTTETGAMVVLDWKVSGFCGNSPTSPKKGAVCVRDPKKGTRAPHKDAQMMMIDGIMVNVAHHLEDIDSSWATQLTIYGWVLGAAIGSKFLLGIDQLVSGGAGSGQLYPLQRVASFRSRVSSTFQLALFHEIIQIWRTILAGPSMFFEGLTPTESTSRCASLDEYYKAYATQEGEDDARGAWFASATRGEW